MVAFLAGSTLLWLAWPATAQQAVGGKSMYRCGANFQDRPCDGAAAGSNAAAPAAPRTAAPAATGAAAKQSGPVVMVPPPVTPRLSAAEVRSAQQKQIRCENFGRQASELRERQKATPQYAASIDVQLKSLEGRMSTDGC